MTEHLKQSISALLDEEASEIEVHRLLREFESDGELRETWVRYQQIRAVAQTQHHLSEAQHLELHTSISAAIDEEIQHDLNHQSRPSWQKNTAGLAVAASLVMAVVVGMNVQQQDSGLNSDVASSEVVTAIGTTIVDAQPVSTIPPSNFQPDAGQVMSDVNQPTEEMVAFNEDDLELRELDSDKQQRLREYLMRHDRSSQLNQMNNQTQTVTFPLQGPSANSPAQNGSGKN